MDRATVLYDEDCGLCRWSADRLRRWDHRGRLAFLPIQTADALGDLDALDPGARYASWHLIEPDDRIWSGGAAIAHVMRRLPGGWPIADLAAIFPGLTDRAYGFVARHRVRFGAMLGQQACSVDPSRPAREPQP